MSNTRLTVVVRRDLQMPAGLLAAQCVHIAQNFFGDKVKNGDQTVQDVFGVQGMEWIADPYISILGVETREDLEKIAKDCTINGLPVRGWRDIVPSPTFEGDSIPECLVGVCIGPADFDAIKAVTVRLRPY